MTPTHDLEMTRDLLDLRRAEVRLLDTLVDMIRTVAHDSDRVIELIDGFRAAPHNIKWDDPA